MNWIKVEVGTPAKAEILAMAGALGCEPDLVFGRVFRLWAWADQNTHSGHAPGVTAIGLLAVIGPSPFNEKLLELMQACGWLVFDAQGAWFPNFDRHNGKSAKARALAANRQEAHRAGAGGITRNAGNGGAVTAPSPEKSKRGKPPIPPLGGGHSGFSPAEGEAEASTVPECGNSGEAAAPPGPDAPPSGRKKSAITFAQWLEACINANVKPVPVDDPVFDYAKDAGLSRELIYLAWLEFKATYLGQSKEKKQKDWLMVFRQSVRRNWYRLWFIDAAGSVSLTTTGRQARQVHDAEFVSAAKRRDAASGAGAAGEVAQGAGDPA